MKERLDMRRPASVLFPYIVGAAVMAFVFFFTDYVWIAMFASAVSIVLILIILIGIAIELKQDDCIHKNDGKKNEMVPRKRLPR